MQKKIKVRNLYLIVWFSAAKDARGRRACIYLKQRPHLRSLPAAYISAGIKELQRPRPPRTIIFLYIHTFIFTYLKNEQLLSVILSL